MITYINNTQKRMIAGAFLLVISLLCFVVFLLIQKDVGMGMAHSPDERPPKNETLSLAPEPIIVERQVVVPAQYVEVNGRKYTAHDVMDILEATGSPLPGFQKWLDHLFNLAESALDLPFNGHVYPAREYIVSLVEPRNCFIEFNSRRFDEGSVACNDVSIETEDGYDLRCDVVIYFEKNIRYEYGKIHHCVINTAFRFSS